MATFGNIQRTPSIVMVEHAQDLLVDVRDRIEQSRVVGYRVLSRLFDEQQLGIVTQIVLNIDTYIDRIQLEESAQKRRIFQRMARLHELQNIIDASRNFCRYVITPRKPFEDFSIGSEITCSVAAIPIADKYKNIEEYVDKCVESVEISYAHAVTITKSCFQSTLALTDACLMQAQTEVDALGMTENKNKRQVRSQLEFLEASIRELKRIIDYFESLISLVPPLE